MMKNIEDKVLDELVNEDGEVTNNVRRICFFIHSLLKSQKEELVEKLEGIKMEEAIKGDDNIQFRMGFSEGAKDANKKIDKIIKEFKEQKK